MAQATSRGSSSRASSRQSSGTPSGSGNGSANGATTMDRVKGAVVPVTSVALGAVAGVVLGQLQAKRRKTVLGIPIPGTGRGSDGLAKSIGEASKQFARLADEVNTSRRKAEQVGKALK